MLEYFLQGGETLWDIAQQEESATVSTVISYGVIPLATLLLAGDTNWLATNFSAIGSVGWGRLVFLLWGILIGMYFYRCLGILVVTMEGGQWSIRGRHLALILFFSAITTPYLPDEMPLRANVHVILALAATLILFFVVLGLLLSVHRTRPQVARPYLLAMAVIGAMTAVLLAMAGIVSTALEVFLTLSNVVLLQKMEQKKWAE